MAALSAAPSEWRRCSVCHRPYVVHVARENPLCPVCAAEFTSVVIDCYAHRRGAREQIHGYGHGFAIGPPLSGFTIHTRRHADLCAEAADALRAFAAQIDAAPDDCLFWSPRAPMVLTVDAGDAVVRIDSIMWLRPNRRRSKPRFARDLLDAAAQFSRLAECGGG